MTVKEVDMEGNYLKRITKILGALFLCALGSYMGIQANVGLAPWECFQTGVMYKTGFLYGNIVVSVGLIVIMLDLILKEKIGLGTICNAMFIGKFIDFFNYIDLIPQLDNFALGVCLLFAGQVVLSIGTCLYIKEGMGAGPRDSFMVAIGRRLNKFPIGAVRWIIEITVIFLGWLMGAKVGVGTLISVCGMSTIMEYTFRFFKFDIKSVKHENLIDTYNSVTKKKKV